MSGIDREQWLKALEDVRETSDEGALTTTEIAAMENVSADTAYRWMKKLQMQGKARLGHKSVTNAAGATVRLPAWILIQPEAPDVDRRRTRARRVRG